MRAHRIPEHPTYGKINTGKKINFTYNGKLVEAFSGDTITSALLASGRSIFSRSFKYHRPRGVYDYQGMGADALMTVDDAPNVLADTTYVQEGMRVQTQNAWPSVEFDLMAVNNYIIPLLPNGFYYKMFHKPKGLWPIAEKFIRKAAGLGKIDREGKHIHTRYEKRYRFPDVCIIGAGPAGLSAALSCLKQEKRVLLIDSSPELGGHSRYSDRKVTNCSVTEWNGLAERDAIQKLIDQVKSYPKLEVLTKTDVFAVYEDRLIAAQSEKDLFKIRADKCILAPGASERDLVFENNDLPGIMQSRGVEKLLADHAICPGENAVVITTHDGGYHTALMLHEAGCRVRAVVDSRFSVPESEFYTKIKNAGIQVYTGKTISHAIGKKHIKAIKIGSVNQLEDHTVIPCDLAVLAVGYKPQLNLLSMGRTRPIWNDAKKILGIEQLPEGMYAAGEVNGHGHFSTLYNEGYEIGLSATGDKEISNCQRAADEVVEALPADIEGGGTHHFICRCMDVTRKEACQSIAEGYDQVESLKRYTSMGMGRCQGKSCHESVARLAAVDSPVMNVDAVPTTMRPPFNPVSFGVLAGRSPHLTPVRRTPMHACHEKLNATFLVAGLWKRPEHYGDVHREVLAVRNGLGMIDVSTLGKIEMSGPDTIKFLHFMFPGKYAKLAVGKTRYSAMIGEDGILFEDGTLSQIEDGKYYLSTTTGNQDAIVSKFWWWITTEGFDVQIKNLSSTFAAVNITGPKSRAFLETVVEGTDMSNNAFPYMSCRVAWIANVPVLMFRIGFTGELGYEIHYPAEYGAPLWELFMNKGAKYGIKPFGVEAQRILRLEKGHLIPGVDTDALSNPYEAGIGFVVKDDKTDFIGKSFLKDFKDKGIREKLVPYVLQDGVDIPDDGVAVIDKGKLSGRVTSSRYSPTLKRGIGLAWVDRSLSDTGSQFKIRLANGKDVNAEVIDHAAYDPDGEKLKS